MVSFFDLGTAAVKETSDWVDVKNEVGTLFLVGSTAADISAFCVLDDFESWKDINTGVSFWLHRLIVDSENLFWLKLLVEIVRITLLPLLDTSVSFGNKVNAACAVTVFLVKKISSTVWKINDSWFVCNEMLLDLKLEVVISKCDFETALFSIVAFPPTLDPGVDFVTIDKYCLLIANAEDWIWDFKTFWDE